MAAIRQSDLERHFPPATVRQYFCDDGSREPGPRLKTACQVASDQAHAVLGKVKAWQSQEAFQTLVSEDLGVQYAVCQLAMAIGSETKPEWYAAGDSAPGAGYRSAAMTALRALRDSKTRSPAEEVTGKNTVSIPRTANARQFEFARRRDRDSSGGF